MHLAEQTGWENANVYTLTHAASLARLGDAWDGVLGSSDLLDLHEQSRLATEIQIEFFGSGRREPRADAVMRVHEALARSTPHHRAALRAFAIASAGGTPPATRTGRSWWPA